jgi:hypothetical protein
VADHEVGSRSVTVLSNCDGDYDALSRRFAGDVHRRHRHEHLRVSSLASRSGDDKPAISKAISNQSCEERSL